MPPFFTKYDVIDVPSEKGHSAGTLSIPALELDISAEYRTIAGHDDDPWGTMDIIIKNESRTLTIITVIYDYEGDTSNAVTAFVEFVNAIVSIIPKFDYRDC